MDLQIITTHTGCDFDALASMVAAKKLYPEAKLCFSGSLSQEVKDFMHLYGWMVPTIEITEKDLGKIKRLILVDTRWINRIGIFNRLVEKRKKVEIHIYDHHPPSPKDIQGDNGICREVGATTSILVDLIKKKKLSLTPLEATLLILGIYEDTGSLSFSSTTSLDLQAAAYLLDKGAKLELIVSFLNRSLTEKQGKLLQDFQKNARTILINGVEVVLIKAEVDDFIGGFSHPLHKFIYLENPCVTFALIKVKNKNKIYILARSRTPSINVGDILSPFGGGGHNLAASAVISGENIENVEKKLCKILEEKMYPQITARTIMRSNIPVVSPETSAGEVKRIMEDKNLEILPVQDKKTKVVGLISKERVEHIIFHNSLSAPIKSYFIKKFASIPPFVSLKKIQQIMIKEETPWLFVCEGDNLLGVLTSKDVYKAFHQHHIEASSENLRHLLEKKIPPRIMKILVEAGKLAYDMGFSVFIVGGFVRDLLLGVENLDIDLVVEGDGIFYAQRFAEKLGVSLTVHREFGTAILNLGEQFKFHIDIATSRREYYPYPAALPQVEPAPLKEDLFRRDFTVNAMAISLNPPNFGNLIDFFGGKEDIKKRKVKVLYPKSFIDDPTRIFRAVRFEQRYKFSLDENTEKFIRKALEEKVFQRLSGTRIKEELIQILEEDRPERNIRRMHNLGILKMIHPKLSLTSRKEKTLDQLVDAIAAYEVLTGEKTRRWLVRLSVLLEDLDEQEMKNFCKRYSFTREEKRILITCSSKAKEIAEKLKAPKMKPSSIYYLLEPFPSEALILAMAKIKSKRVMKRIHFYLSHLKKITLEINGNDLKKMGYKPSPKFSYILEETKKAKLNGLLKTKEDEIEFVRKNFGKGDT